jgi:hypothetical protein
MNPSFAVKSTRPPEPKLVSIDPAGAEVPPSPASPLPLLVPLLVPEDVPPLEVAPLLVPPASPPPDELALPPSAFDDVDDEDELLQPAAAVTPLSKRKAMDVCLVRMHDPRR